MRIIGITGGSGSGKTTASEIIKEYGAFCINADKVARDLTSIETEYLRKIIDVFGYVILDENKNLNRKMLASVIFDDKDKKKELDRLTYTYVVAEIEKILEQNKSKESILIDAPLLIESGLSNKCDIVISVLCDFNTRIKRICARDNITFAEAEKRLLAQEKDEFYIKNSDFVIYDNSDIYHLREEINKIIKRFLTIL